jgi:hypothetical protein
MEYELAKELEGAGFPQQDRHFYWSNHTEPPTSWDVNVLDDLEIPTAGMCADPTLSELIEACGKQFGSLHAVFDGRRGETYGKIYGWHAVGAGRAFPNIAESTPEEAVARLWLALRPKPNA